MSSWHGNARASDLETKLVGVETDDLEQAAAAGDGHDVRAWEEQVLSATGFKRVGRHSEYAM
jgi:hypothetical protein